MIMERLYWNAYLATQMRGQARYPFQPLARILGDQARRVRAIVAHAYRYVPYYRETMARLGLSPADFRVAEDLARLPLLEREQLQRDPERFISTAWPISRHLKLRSGGSTGAPCTIYHDAQALFQSAAHGERERTILASLVGRSFGYRETVIASAFGASPEVQGYLRRHALFPRGARIERQYLSLLDPPEVNARLLNEFRPDVIQSYGSYLEILFPYLQAAGVAFHRPRVVTYASDGLSESVRRLIVEDLHIPVLSTYQAIEAFKIGFECLAHRGLHLNVDLCPLRIVDAEGRPVEPGASGDVVVSNLVNRATVVLNYRLGDVARLLPERCPCGRTLPLLSFVEGRADDLLRLPSGELLHPQAVRTIFTEEQQIWRYQVVQRTPTRFGVAIVAADTLDRESARKRIAAKFVSRFGPGVSVDMAFVESLPCTPAGKFRPVMALGVSPGSPAETEGGAEELG